MRDDRRGQAFGLSRFDTFGAGPARAGTDGLSGAGRARGRRWPPVLALSAAAGLSLGLWGLIALAVKAVF